MADLRLFVGISSMILGTCFACAAPPSSAVREWFETAYAPAMRHIMDPDLAPWSASTVAGRDGGAGPARPRPSPEDMMAGCAEALRRADDWRDALEAAPDTALATVVRTFVRDHGGKLRKCARTGDAPGEVSSIGPVIDRLRRLGVRLPQG